MVATLILLRHGRTAYNHSGRFQGQKDVPLDEVGLEQAGAAGADIASRFAVTRIVSSDLTRARQTAEALSAAVGVPVETCPRLREISVGEWEDHTREEVGEKWPTELAAWLSGEEMRPPGGESRTEASARVAERIGELVAESDDEAVLAVVAHGAVIRGATEILLGLDGAAGTLGALENCTTAVLTPRRGEWVLRSWGGPAPTVG